MKKNGDGESRLALAFRSLLLQRQKRRERIESVEQLDQIRFLGSFEIMAVRIRCKACGTGMKVRDELAGKKDRCKKCKEPCMVVATQQTNLFVMSQVNH